MNSSLESINLLLLEVIDNCSTYLSISYFEPFRTVLRLHNDKLDIESRIKLFFCCQNESETHSNFRVIGSQKINCRGRLAQKIKILENPQYFSLIEKFDKIQDSEQHLFHLFSALGLSNIFWDGRRFGRANVLYSVGSIPTTSCQSEK